MSGLAVRLQGGLPAKPDDLAKFIIVAQEKLKAVKAEIRAIQRLDVAKDIYDQKVKEQAQLQELVLLAYLRMGQLTRELPTSAGGRPSTKSPPSDGVKKTKSQAVRDLGLSTSQVGRMEQIAAHPEIVDEVIAESRVGQTEATQTEVLRRIKELRVPTRSEDRQNNPSLRLFQRATSYRGLPDITDEVLDAVVASDRTLCIDIDRLSEAIQFLSEIRDQLLEKSQVSSRDFFESIALQEEFEPDLELEDDYQEEFEPDEAIAQALDACSRKDCAHCSYQGKGIKCARRLLEDAAKMITDDLHP